MYRTRHTWKLRLDTDNNTHLSEHNDISSLSDHDTDSDEGHGITDTHYTQWIDSMHWWPSAH
jgi:hypothetical protein